MDSLLLNETVDHGITKRNWRIFYFLRLFWISDKTGVIAVGYNWYNQRGEVKSGLSIDVT